MLKSLRFNDWDKIEAVIRENYRDDHFMCAHAIARGLDAIGFAIIRKSDLNNEETRTEPRGPQGTQGAPGDANPNSSQTALAKETEADEAAADFKARWLARYADASASESERALRRSDEASEVRRDVLVSRVHSEVFAAV